MGKDNTNKKMSKFVYPLAVLGVSSMLLFGAVEYVGADDYDVIHTQLEDSVNNEDDLPVLHYLVAGGEPENLEYDISELEGKVSHYINTTEDDYTIEGIGNVSAGNLELQYEDIESEFSNNSLLDYGYIGIYGEGNFVLNSEDLIGVDLGDNKTEHIAEYNEETGEYELLAQRGGVIPIEEIGDSNLALITFIEQEDEIELASNESGDELEKSDESEEDSEPVEDIDSGSEDTEDTIEEDESEEDTESTETEEQDSETEGTESNEDDIEEESNEDDIEEESNEDDIEEEYSEIDTTNSGGSGTFLGDELNVILMESEGSEGEFAEEDDITEEEIEEMYEDKYVIEATPMQINALTEDIGNSLEDTAFYSENGIESAQDLYDKFGLYNIPDTFLELYREELDENNDGIMGNAPDKPVISGITLKKLSEEERQEESGESDTTVGNPGLGDLDEEDINEEDATPEDFELEEESPDDWDTGNQEVDDEDGSMEEDDVEIEYPEGQDPENDSEYEYTDEDEIVIEDDMEYEEVDEEETDDTLETEDDSKQLEEEHDDLVNQEDEVVDDGSNIKEIGGVDVTDEEGNDTDGIVIEGDDHDDWEENLEEEETDLDSENNSSEGNTQDSGEDNVIDSKEGNENAFEETDDTFQDQTNVNIGLSEINGENIIVELGVDGNVEEVRYGEEVIAQTVDGNLELVDGVDIEGISEVEELEDDILNNGISFIDNETSESLEEQGVNVETIDVLEEDNLVQSEELPDTGVSNINYTIPIAFTLIVLGGVGLYVSRRKVK